MTPLDLTRQAPRSARVEVAGIAYLARAIDKVRAQLSGGNSGAYIVVHERPTMSSLFYRRMNVTPEEFATAVRGAASEDDVAAWLRARTDDAALERWRAQLFGLRLVDVPEPQRAGVVRAHPVAAAMPLETPLIDIFDADDAASFGR